MQPHMSGHTYVGTPYRIRNRVRIAVLAALGAAGLVASVAVAPNAQAQDGLSSGCQSQVLLGDQCQKTLDLFRYLTPQLGTLVAGGNATLGLGGTIGGFPHFRLSARGNMMAVRLPHVDDVAIAPGPPQQSTYEVGRSVVFIPQLDASIGIMRGIPLGITNVGGVDLLLSASYVPSFDAGSVYVKAGEMQIGAGVRVGILQETLVIPGISFTYLRRGLPSLDIDGIAGSDTLSLRNFKTTTDAWRFVASKNLLIFGLAAGVGRDRYASDASLILPGVSSPQKLEQNVTRTNYFVDGIFTFPLLRVIAEVGRVSGGNVVTYNQFDKNPNDARYYTSVGFRVGF